MAVPVIVDTDIGSNIDDSWALALALRSPELDVRLVTVVSGDTTYRAHLAAELLTAAGRDEVAVGAGIGGVGRSTAPLAEAADEFDLAHYVVGMVPDGVGAIVDTVTAADQQVTILAIGPLTNVAAALEREPGITDRARVVSMHGALDVGYGDRPGPAAEYNASADVEATRAVHAAGWDVTVAPLDVTNEAVLTGPEMASVRAVADRGDQLAVTLAAHHDLFLEQTGRVGGAGRITPLHDAVAVHLAGGHESFLELEEVRVRVDDDGTIRRDDRGHEIRMATSWRDLPAFLDWMTRRLTLPGSAPASS